MLQLHGLFFKSLTDKFVGVSDYQSECLGVTTFRVKRDTFVDFKKTDILKKPQGRLLQLIYKYKGTSVYQETM